MKKLTIHPAFDLKTKTWFLETMPGVEAKSIRELRAKVRAETGISNVHVRGYYANGAPPVVWSVDPVPHRLEKVSIPRASTLPRTKPRVTFKDHEELEKEIWRLHTEENLTQREIVARMKIRKQTVSMACRKMDGGVR